MQSIVWETIIAPWLNRGCKKCKKQEDFSMNNIPKVKIGIVAVSRDCFPESSSDLRK